MQHIARRATKLSLLVHNNLTFNCYYKLAIASIM